MLSRVTSGRTPILLIRLECIVRKLRKSTVMGKPSFLTVGLRYRRSKLRRFTGPPFALVKMRSSGFRYFDLCQAASRTPRRTPKESSGILRRPANGAGVARRQVGGRPPARTALLHALGQLRAGKGVVAQTVSSYGLHRDYHQPSDDIAHIDFKHMTTVIGSLIGLVRWLVNSDFRPPWRKGGRP